MKHRRVLIEIIIVLVLALVIAAIYKANGWIYHPQYIEKAVSE